VKALVGRIPRGLKDHRGTAGKAYTAYCRSMVERLGQLPPHAMPTLRECGRVVLELERVHGEIDTARAKSNRRREERRLRRVAASLRGQLMALERRLEEIAHARNNGHGRTLAEQLSGGGR
jgi:hypothetical protein